jgi:hypothetical protein
MATIQKHCSTCGQPRPFEKKEPNHILHFLISVFTCGGWVIIWLFLSFGNSFESPRCKFCGGVSSDSNSNTSSKKNTSLYVILQVVIVLFLLYISRGINFSSITTYLMDTTLPIIGDWLLYLIFPFSIGYFYWRFIRSTYKKYKHLPNIKKWWNEYGYVILIIGGVFIITPINLITFKTIGTFSVAPNILGSILLSSLSFYGGLFLKFFISK